MKVYFVLLLLISAVQSHAQTPELPPLSIGQANLEIAVPAAKRIVQRLTNGEGTRYCTREGGGSVRILADFENRVISFVPNDGTNSNRLPENAGFIEVAKTFDVKKEMLEDLRKFGINGGKFESKGYYLSYASSSGGQLIRTNVFMLFRAEGSDTVLVLNDDINHSFFGGTLSFCNQ